MAGDQYYLKCSVMQLRCWIDNAATPSTTIAGKVDVVPRWTWRGVEGYKERNSGGRRRQTKHQHEISALVSSSGRGGDDEEHNEISPTRLTI